jgi:hypothetical protein
VSRSDADDGFVDLPFPKHGLSGIGQIPVCYEDDRKKQASDNSEVSS